MNKILISACLLGLPVRHDGLGKELKHELLAQWQSEGRLVSVCPELMAGFPVPRAPAEIQKNRSCCDVLIRAGRIAENNGLDVTEEFLLGANRALVCPV